MAIFRSLKQRGACFLRGLTITSEQSAMITSLRTLAALLPLALAPALCTRPALAQRGGAALPDMQLIARSLGVTCEYCHVGAPGGRTRSRRKI